MLFNSDIRRIKKSGLFDAAYYLQTYSDVRAANVGPLKHFVKYGWKEGRNPSAEFDTNFYLSTYPDVALAGKNPLIHYILHGKKEGRKIHQNDTSVFSNDSAIKRRIKKYTMVVRILKRNPEMVTKFLIMLKNEGIKKTILKVAQTINNKDYEAQLLNLNGSYEEIIYTLFKVVPYYTNNISYTSNQQEIKSTIAIHLHLYYIDMIEECIRYLENVPYKFDLYVSVSNKDYIKKSQDSFRNSLLKVGKIVVEVVPNRGRDIAPMIIQFGKRLSKYKYISHIHTKKSLHNDQLDTWFSHSMKLLYGTQEKIEQIFSLLQNDAKIIYPENFIDIRFDNGGWSENREKARYILEKYTKKNISDFPFVEFPQGSMFWAKSESLKDILNLPLKYNDFPIEPIEEDGTLAHALERLILIFTLPYEGRCYRLHKNDSMASRVSYESQIDFSSTITHSSIKVLSYYLPQFHPTPENDMWHGNGFTEWYKVTTANPLFVGHYQQHIPHDDIGYYMIDSSDILKKQASMMKKAGVHGQIFYHYWFTGKLILEHPAQLLLEDKSVDMPFCFCWANENWTKRWDGNEQEILLGQEYSPEDALNFIQYLIPFFKDKRYIGIDNRPVLFIYRPSSIPNFEIYKKIWSDECEKQSLPAPYIVATLTRGTVEPTTYGMDAAVERVLHDWTNGGAPEIKHTLLQYKSVNGSILDYTDVSKYYHSQKDVKDFVYFRSLVPMWDNTARYGQEAYAVHNSTPGLFQQWLQDTIKYTEMNLSDDKQIIVVNAWNEWAEGAHLEPDTKHGYAYLNSIGRALSDIHYDSNQFLINEELLDMNISLDFSEDVKKILLSKSIQKNKLLTSLKNSTLFKKVKLVCSDQKIVDTINTFDHTMHILYATKNEKVSIRFQNSCVFDDGILELLVKKAIFDKCFLVVPNTLNHEMLSILNEDIVLSKSLFSQLTLMVVNKSASIQYKKFGVCYEAICCVLDKNDESSDNFVTTIIRYHHSGNLHLLKNALLSLISQANCIVQPYIAIQDLTEEDEIQLKNMLKQLPWIKDIYPIIEKYTSTNEISDMRSVMLNDSFNKANSKYVAFLDYDDILFPKAYEWMLKRLKTTMKNATFGHVYVTYSDTTIMKIQKREKVYEYGFSYKDFFNCNHAPLHSIMFNKDLIEIEKINYFPDMKYMEDYYFTLQIFSEDGTDWESLKYKNYIGDYIHSLDGQNTLAIVCNEERCETLNDPFYIECENRIHELRNEINSRTRV